MNNTFSLRDEHHFKIEWFSGTGKGGQHRNKTQNCCRIIHLPSGIKQEIQGRSRESNKTQAMNLLIEKLNNELYGMKHDFISEIMKSQKGSGMRADKIRTYRFQDGIVIDHRNDKKMKVDKYMKGNMNNLWN